MEHERRDPHGEWTEHTGSQNPIECVPSTANTAGEDSQVLLNLDPGSGSKLQMGPWTLIEIIIATLTLGGSFWYVQAGMETLRRDNVSFQRRLDQVDTLNQEVIRLGTKIDYLTEEIRFLRQRVPMSVEARR